ncbi:hypothetical protein Ancab_026875 [Ancistrocladus abbreviatus]
MAASSSAMPPFFGEQNQPIQQHSSLAAAASSSAPAQKKKRNLPGTPNPDAEVIALSPKTLMATNRFICEVCNKGFQREQNLQLHRRGHNLPWKLRQKTTKDQPVKKKVYLCPEPTCVHHDPARALGDLTGIKKHYSRKHGEKKFKCEKCSKRYAVQSDWKAHSKTCGTREYRCDCGTLFSRRDSFITHRAFCDALSQESARHPTSATHLFGGGGGGSSSSSGIGLALSHPQGINHSNHTNFDILNLGAAQPGRFNHLLTSSSSLGSAFRPPSLPPLTAANFYNISDSSQASYSAPNHSQISEQLGIPDLQNNPTDDSASLFNLGFFSNATHNADGNNSSGFLFPSQFNNHHGKSNGGDGSGGSAAAASLFSSSLLAGGGNKLFGTSSSPMLHSIPHMSATALLQKAAHMGSTSSNLNPCANPSVLPAFGLTSSGGGGTKSGTKLLAANFGSIFGMGENENLKNLMNSLGGGSSSSMIGFGGGGGTFNNDDDNSMNDAKAGGIFATSDKLTRDFLGVGEIMRSMSKGSGAQLLHGFDSSMDSERNNPSTNLATSQSFSGGGGSGGGNFQ